MAGIPPLTKENLTAEQARVAENIYADRGNNFDGPNTILLRIPELAERCNKLGIYLRDGTSLAKPLSELTILVTARLWNAQFEWYVHEILGAKSGLDRDVMTAIRENRRPDFEHEGQEIVYDYVVELQQKRRVSNAVHDRAVALLGEEGVIDLVAIAGYYSMVAITCNAFQPALPGDADPPLKVSRK